MATDTYSDGTTTYEMRTYGAVRWAGRDKSLDPVEASTAALYDAEERGPHRPA
jgi:hypothetical protein